MSSEIMYMNKNWIQKDLDLKFYPGGEPIIKHDENFQGIENILLRPRSLNSFMACIFWIEALQMRQGSGINLILPYVPGSRQDRLNDSGDYLFTAKSIANILNRVYLKSLTIVDNHSDVFPALMNCKVNNIHIDHIIQSYSNNWKAVLAPDAGARKRAEAFAKFFKLPVYQGWKTRDIETGAIKGFGAEEFTIEPGKVVIVDDICDGGGTFMGLVDVLDQRNIAADLFVSHGIFSQGTSKLLDRFEHIFCTDSILTDHTGINVTDISIQLLRKKYND